VIFQRFLFPRDEILLHTEFMVSLSLKTGELKKNIFYNKICLLRQACGSSNEERYTSKQNYCISLEDATEEVIAGDGETFSGPRLIGLEITKKSNL